MSSLPVRSAKPTHLVRLGSEEIRVRLEGGALRCAVRKVRLYLGTELYWAGKGRPGENDKIVPYQPGYMKLVAAMGGILMCPPTAIDPVTGRTVPNPRRLDNGALETIGVCIVRDTLGNRHVSIQKNAFDPKQVLRQNLLKIQNPEIKQILPDEMAKEMERTELRGWVPVPLPLFEGYRMWVNASSPTVIEAMVDSNNLYGTNGQRAASRAERLAADHCPATRHSWVISQLWQDIENEESQIDRIPADQQLPQGWRPKKKPYAELEVICWSEDRNQESIEAFLADIAKRGDAVDDAIIVAGEHIDNATDAEIDDDPNPESTPRQITEKADIPALIIPARQPEPVAVHAPAPEPAPVAAPAPVQAPAPVPAPAPAAAAPAPVEDPRTAALRRKAVTLEGKIPPADVQFSRNAAGVPSGIPAAEISTLLIGDYVVQLSNVLAGME